VKATELAAIMARNFPLADNLVIALRRARSDEEIRDILYGEIENMCDYCKLYNGLSHAAAIQRAEEYIDRNYNHKIRLDEIATYSGLSSPYFSTIFKNEMGETFTTYLNRRRVERAAILLVESSLSLHAIADACGFEDQSWFSKIFKSFTGLSPQKFRQQGGHTKTVIDT
jgi:AraC-like DNA-binding protein